MFQLFKCMGVGKYIVCYSVLARSENLIITIKPAHHVYIQSLVRPVADVSVLWSIITQI